MASPTYVTGDAQSSTSAPSALNSSLASFSGSVSDGDIIVLAVDNDGTTATTVSNTGFSNGWTLLEDVGYYSSLSPSRSLRVWWTYWSTGDATDFSTNSNLGGGDGPSAAAYYIVNGADSSTPIADSNSTPDSNDPPAVNNAGADVLVIAMECGDGKNNNFTPPTNYTNDHESGTNNDGPTSNASISISSRALTSSSSEDPGLYAPAAINSAVATLSIWDSAPQPSGTAAVTTPAATLSSSGNVQNPPDWDFACGAECQMTGDSAGAGDNPTMHWPNAANSGNITIDTTNTRNGVGASFKWTTPDTTSEVTQWPLAAHDGGEYYWRFSLYFQSTPSLIGGALFQLYDNTTGGVAAIGTSGGSVYAQANGVNSSTNNFSPSTSTWYDIEFYYNVSTKVLRWRRKTAGGSWTTSETVTGTGTALGTDIEVKVGINANHGASGFVFNMDDIVGAWGGNASAVYDPTGTNGHDYAVARISPNADGTHSFSTSGDFTSDTGDLSPSDTTIYQHLDLGDMENTGEYIRGNGQATNDYIEVNYEPSPSGFTTPLAWTVVQHSNGGASNGSWTLQTGDDGTNWYTETYATRADADHTARGTTHNDAPDGDPLTTTVIDNLRTRIRADSTTTGWSVYQVAVEVLYESYGGGNTGTADVTAPAATLSASGYVKPEGTADVTAPAASLSADGTVTNFNTGTADVTAQAATLTSDGVESFPGSADVTAPAAQLSASGWAEITGSADVTAQAATLTADAIESFPATSDVTAPAATLSAAGFVTTADLGYDSFNRSGSMGTSDSGHTWTNTTGGTDTFATDGDEANSGTLANGDYTSSTMYLAHTAAGDMVVRAKYRWDSDPVEGGTNDMTLALTGRYASATNYRWVVEVMHGGTSDIRLRFRAYNSGGWVAPWNETVVSTTWTDHTTEEFWVELVVYGNSPTYLEGRVWKDGAGRPSSADISWNGTDTDIETNGYSGMFAGANDNSASHEVFVNQFEAFSYTPSPTGTADVTAAPASLSATGWAEVTGTADVTAPAASLVASGMVANNIGSADVTAPAATLSATGWAEVTGTADVTTAPAALTSDAIESFPGTSDVTAPAAQLSATGWAEVTGSADVTAPAASLTADGTVKNNVGISDVTAPAASLAASGWAEVTGTATLTAPAASLSASGYEKPEGTADVTAPAATLTSAGAVANVVAVGAVTAASATLTASGTVTNVVTGTATLLAPASALDAQAAESFPGSSDVTAPAAQLAATGWAEVTGTATLTAPAATLTSAGVEVFSGDADVTAPAATLSATGSSLTGVGGTADVTAPAATLSASGHMVPEGTATLTAPAATLSANGTVTVPSVSGTATLTAPAATLSATGAAGAPPVSGTATLTAPAATVSAQGAEVFIGSAVVTAPAATLDASGEETFAGSADVTAPSASLTAAGWVEVIGTATLTAAAPQLDAAGTTVNTGSAAVEAPASSLAAQGWVQVFGIATLTAPPATLTSVGNGGVWERNNPSATITPSGAHRGSVSTSRRVATIDDGR